MTTDPLVVTRTIALRGADAAAVVAALAAKPGMHDVHAVGHGKRVRVRYDLRRMRLGDVEATVEAAGAAPARGLLTVLWRGLASFTEANKLASVRAEVHPCCNQPPDEK